ncbi:hypothetical protein TanjilG_04761 [Lupinus angustifolius]|uniref:TOD1/MUCI70 glycosyltransferase-like domain-containing protein n=1 Tax=Lupinus angustifolius TaxID=3871 RepID=A0A4P1RK80_LUPAN|nr:hypothetical protein TanjilG_04761 [Lupinus angustifolius]
MFPAATVTRQQGIERFGVRVSGTHDHHNGSSDHVAVGIRAAAVTNKQHRLRRSARSSRVTNLSMLAIVLFLFLVLVLTFLAFSYISRQDISNNGEDTDDVKNDSDFLTNVPRIERKKVLDFGNTSGGHGRDSRYWDKDDRRRDDDYNEDTRSKDTEEDTPVKMNHDVRSIQDDSYVGLKRKGVGLYNEAGRHELKRYEAEYEASLKSVEHLTEDGRKVSHEADLQKKNVVDDIDDDYDDFFDFHDAQTDDSDDSRSMRGKPSNSNVRRSGNEVQKESLDSLDAGNNDDNSSEDAEGASSLKASQDGKAISRHESNGQSNRKSHPETKKKPKRRKFSASCEMKLLNSTSQLVEPLESRKFARFNLHYTDIEEKPLGGEQWMPRFAGHQSLEERESSFLARDQKISCGFVKGPEGSSSTGFDLSEDDENYISRCHIAVISCIFGNSDRLRTPATKTITRFSRKNVCFVMFTDEVTVQTLISEGHEPDSMGFIGFWKLVVVKNLPYDDMRRVGKIPKLLPHRLFPFARFDDNISLKEKVVIIIVDGILFGWIANYVFSWILYISWSISCGGRVMNLQYPITMTGIVCGKRLHKIRRDQKISCGFVKGPEGSSSTGFDLSEDDENYISRCHIAVISCIFGNSDRLRTPATKTITRFSRKNVCFVMFTDEVTVQTLISEGHEPDSMGFIGFWKLVVVKNLPYDDMRRVGKIPKLLPHRLFPFARYSIWLDSKLRLQLDPLHILEYFLWRKGYEFAISNHYDRHCVWEEVAQNKKLNKYNHTVIDQQFAFYQADGLKRFNASDPNKLLSSNVPEGSFIIRAHTPMSNLFSCLWFNEVDRFTPRDQLSFAYTYQKLRRMNPDKPFHLNMFKDCERRHIAKLFRHRTDEKRNSRQKATN